MSPASGLLIFILLQCGDLATTLIGLERGSGEMSPVLRIFMNRVSPVTVMSIDKLLAIAAAILVVRYGRWPRLIYKLNIIYGVLLAWNLLQIAKTL